MSFLKCGKAVIISDIHLGHNKCEHKSFLRFLKTYNWFDVDSLILLGDTFDFWRKSEAKVFIENRDVIEQILTLPCKVIFVRGNHDYLLGNLAEWFYKETYSRRFDIVKSISLRSGQRNFHFIHGYELEVFSDSYLGPLGLKAYENFAEAMCLSRDCSRMKAARVLWDLLFGIQNNTKNLKQEFKKFLRPALQREFTAIEKLARSNAKNILFGFPKGDVLVFGHTHRPFKDEDVVNTGSWSLHIEEKANNYLVIDNGRFELKEYNDRIVNNTLMEFQKPKLQLIVH